MEIWMKIFDDIVGDIRNSVYKENDKMPSENILASKYQVPRMDIRLAYKRLTEMGYIYSVQGKGRYFKGSPQKIQLHLAGNTSFTRKMKEQGINLKSVNIFCEKIQFRTKIYQKLRVSKDIRVYKVGRLRYVDDEPVALHISYVAESVFPNIEREGKNIKSMFDFYRQKGFTEYYHTYSILNTAIANNYERELFNCPSITPVIIIETQCMDKASDIVLERTEIIYRGDRFSYRIFPSK